MANLYDKNFREIMVGDVLRVFHFVGRSRRRHFMFKQVVDVVTLGRTDPKPYLKISHLNMSDEHYHEREDGRTLADYEIVQSIKYDHLCRPKRSSD